MADTTKIRIGMRDARELEFEVEDGAAVEKAFGAAMVGGEPVFWVEDSKGGRYGLVVVNVAFLELPAQDRRSIGL